MKKKKTIHELLIVDAFVTFTRLKNELGRQPEFGEYVERIYKKVDSELAARRLSFPRDFKKLFDCVSYSDVSPLDIAFNSIKTKYGFSNEAFKRIYSELMDIASESVGCVSHPWHHLESKTRFGAFLRDANTKILGKVSSEFFDLHSKDPITAFQDAFFSFHMRDFKTYLKSTIDLALKANLDKKELIAFTYKLSVLFGRHAIRNGQTTWLARMKTRFFHQ